MDFETLRIERMAAFLEAVEELSDWLLNFGSEERPRQFLNVASMMEAELFWRNFHTQWSTFDSIPHEDFEALMIEHRDEWLPEFMSPESAAAYAELPESFVAYRGQSADDPAGLSWTLNRVVAEGFARGHRMIPVKNPIVIEATISKAAVAGVFLDRNESEIVIFSAREAKDRKTTP
jgi:hypothetical protein